MLVGAGLFGVSWNSLDLIGVSQAAPRSERPGADGASEHVQGGDATTEPEGGQAQGDGAQPAGIPDSSPRVRIAVIDALSGEPILVFRYRVDLDQSRRKVGARSIRLTPPPPWIVGEGREVDIQARPDKDLLWVIAPGYQDFHGDLPEPDPSTGLMLVGLTPTVELAGRVLLDGVPAAGIHLRAIARNSVANPSGSLEAISDVEGRYTIQGLSGDWVRVEARDGAGRVADRTLCIRGQMRLEVDPLELLPMAAVGVHVVVEPGDSLEQLRLSLIDRAFASLHRPLPMGRQGGTEEWLQERASWISFQNLLRFGSSTDASGRASFAELAPGEYLLALNAPIHGPGRLLPQPVSLTLAAGELREVRFDLSRAGLVPLDLTVTAGDRDLRAWSVALWHPHRQTHWHSDGHIPLRRLDGSGRVQADVPVMEGAWIQLTSRASVSLMHPAYRLDLPAGAGVSATVEFPLADLELRLPSDFVLPEPALLFVDFTPAELPPQHPPQAAQVVRRLRLSLGDPGHPVRHGYERPSPDTVRLGPFLAQRGELRVRIFEDPSGQTPYFTARQEHLPIYEHTLAVAFEAGEYLPIALP